MSYDVGNGVFPLCHPAPTVSELETGVGGLSAKLPGGRRQKEGQTRPANAGLGRDGAGALGAFERQSQGERQGWRSQKEETGENTVRTGQRLEKSTVSE